MDSGDLHHPSRFLMRQTIASGIRSTTAGHARSAPLMCSEANGRIKDAAFRTLHNFAMGGAIEPFFVTNAAGGMQQHQPKQPVSDQRMQDQAVAMAIALADSGRQQRPEKTDSDAALALHLALNDQPADRITFRSDPSGRCPAAPRSACSMSQPLSTVCNIHRPVTSWDLGRLQARHLQ